MPRAYKKQDKFHQYSASDMESAYKMVVGEKHPSIKQQRNSMFPGAHYGDM